MMTIYLFIWVNTFLQQQDKATGAMVVKFACIDKSRL